MSKNKTDLNPGARIKLAVMKVIMINKGKTTPLPSSFAEFLPSDLRKTRNTKVFANHSRRRRGGGGGGGAVASPHLVQNVENSGKQSIYLGK